MDNSVSTNTKRPSRIVGKPLRTERLPCGKRKLLCDLKVELNQIQVNRTFSGLITVNSGFVTDFSSIPTLCHWIVRWSKVDIAGVVHDWLYAKGCLTRTQSDEIWRIIAVSGQHCASDVQAYICWIGLRILGGFAWRKHKKLRHEIS